MSFGRAMLMAAAACILGVMSMGSAQAEEKVVLDGSTTVGPIAKAFAGYYKKNNPGVEVSVSESGSGNGAKGIINGTCDIGNMSRHMKDKEEKAAKAKGVNPVHHVIAKDGLAICVHPSNPVKNITMEKLKEVYEGKITNWKQLGGPNVKIICIQRDGNSGTQETFEKMVMKKAKITGDAETAGSNGQLKTRIAATPGAIGFIGLGFVDKHVKAITVNGVEATEATVLNGKYPINRPLYMVTNGQPKEGSHVARFIALYKDPDGQKLIREIGFVPMPIEKKKEAKEEKK